MTSTENTFINIFKGVEKTAAEAIKAEEGDYILDGLLHCGKCHTPKQVRIEILGQERTPYCLCKCAAEKRDKEEAEFRQRQRMQEAERMRNYGFADSEMKKWTFAADDGANPKISKVALNYVENFGKMRKAGKGLLLFGTVGTGKTFYAACIANALIDRGYPCLMTSFSRIANTLSGMFDGKQAYIDSLNKFDLLILDDLAAERDTEYMNEIIQTVIDSRYRAGLPTIVTTNLTANEIKNPVDIHKQRTYSRLLEMTVPVHVEGKDRRRKKLQEDYNEFNELLGL